MNVTEQLHFPLLKMLEANIALLEEPKCKTKKKKRIKKGLIGSRSVHTAIANCLFLFTTK